MDKKALLLGLGLDAKDGHLRLTKGENFRVYGGSEETHEYLQEKCVKFNEKLKRKGKTLDEINTKEFYNIAQEIGLKTPPKKPIEGQE
jgi:hypothetical protein